MKRIAIAGNPNSGKTCLFNNLTGANQRVGNYPGVTVEFVTGETRIGGEKVQVVDLPGTYSLTAYSQEELVARDYIVDERPELIINVVDASNLERNLYLTTQLIELRVPMIIALNMLDVAEKKGHSVDARRLSEILGVGVVKIAANKGHGLDNLKKVCQEAAGNPASVPTVLVYSHELQGALPRLEEAVGSSRELCGHFPAKWVAVKLLEEDDQVCARLAALPDGGIKREVVEALRLAREHVMAHSGEEPATAVVESRYGVCSGVCREVVTMSEGVKQMLTDKIDRVVCNRFMGWLILCAVVYLLFLFTFGAAQDINWIPLFNGEWTSPTGLCELFFDSLGGVAERHIKTPWLLSLVNDGLISGVGGVLGFVPLIFFMFMFIAVLEDTGYIARVAFILDRVLRVFGLQGKSVMAMVVSGGLGAGGCAVPGVMATRTMREEKDRLVTILVAPFMNCGAKMPVYAMLIAAFFSHSRGAMMFLLWLLSWVFALGCAYVLRRWVVKGEQTPFVMELPVYHMPTFKGVLMDTWNRTYLYIKKAATVILAFSVILWALMYYPGFDESAMDHQRDLAKKTFTAAVAGGGFASLFSDPVLERTLELAEGKSGAESAEEKRFMQSLNDFKSGTQVADAELFEAFNKYRDSLKELDALSRQRRLESSFAGRFGMLLTPVSRWAGFDWKENIALIGGFAAKEVILGTMGTAYAMAEATEESLSEYLGKAPGWNRLRAVALLVFIMAYAPCLVTVAAIKKETGKWRWAIFSTAYSTLLAFVAAVLIYQVGSLF